MNKFLESLVFVIIGVACFTLLYKILPHRKWTNQKPGFTLLPKYVATYSKPFSEIEANLEKILFEKNSNNKYSRGKVYGDFSAKAIKLSVQIDKEKKQIKLHSSFFGVLFDTGDIWKVAEEIING